MKLYILFDMKERKKSQYEIITEQVSELQWKFIKDRDEDFIKGFRSRLIKGKCHNNGNPYGIWSFKDSFGHIKEQILFI